MISGIDEWRLKKTWKIMKRAKDMKSQRWLSANPQQGFLEFRGKKRGSLSDTRKRKPLGLFEMLLLLSNPKSCAATFFSKKNGRKRQLSVLAKCALRPIWVLRLRTFSGAHSGEHLCYPQKMLPPQPHWMGDTSNTKNWWWPTLWIVDENRSNQKKSIAPSSK